MDGTQELTMDALRSSRGAHGIPEEAPPFSRERFSKT
jgi:hypothetical protein